MHESIKRFSRYHPIRSKRGAHKIPYTDEILLLTRFQLGHHKMLNMDRSRRTKKTRSTFDPRTDFHLRKIILGKKIAARVPFKQNISVHLAFHSAL